jgi:hypothetical protein
MEVLDLDIQSQSSPAVKGAPTSGQTKSDQTKSDPVKSGQPSIAVALRRTSRVAAGIRIKGRTTGVVVGELVNLLITDRSGKSITLTTKVAGNGKFRALTELTSLDGSSLQAQSFWMLDSLPGVAKASLLDKRYEQCTYMQATSLPWPDGIRHYS